MGRTSLRNHDELTLDQLTEDEREEVFAAFGPEPEHAALRPWPAAPGAPMSTATRAAIRMVYSLLFTLPGTPVLFYGEEIGMGENLGIGGRLGVRTPMQWTAGPQRRVLAGGARQAGAPRGAGRRSAPRTSTSPSSAATLTPCGA